MSRKGTRRWQRGAVGLQWFLGLSDCVVLLHRLRGWLQLQQLTAAAAVWRDGAATSALAPEA